RQCPDRVLHGFLHADGGRGAPLGDGLHRHALAASPDRRQGGRREPECRRRPGLLECRERRLLVPGQPAYPDAARPLAQLAGGAQARGGPLGPLPYLAGSRDEGRRADARHRSEAMSLSTDEIASGLAAAGYVAEPELATAVSLMQLLKRPLLLEGE